jgi:hypothetical protein
VSARSLSPEARRHRHSKWFIISVGLIVTTVVAISTQWAFPPSNDWRTALYVLLGILVTLVLANTSDVVQGKIQKVQFEIRDFLMERLGSRHERTAALIELCRTAGHEFRAVTYFPVVGIQDDPETAPAEYLRALEETLAKEVDVTLVSVSCTEARRHCELENFGDASTEALEWVEDRLKGLARRFPNNLELITVPGDAITVNVCHNDSTALMYHVDLKNDKDLDQEQNKGFGFKSADARILAVAKGGVTRYRRYNSSLQQRGNGRGSMITRTHRVETL